MFCRDKDLEQLLATIRQLEDKVKKLTGSKIINIMVFHFNVFTFKCTYENKSGDTLLSYFT